MTKKHKNSESKHFDPRALEVIAVHNGRFGDLSSPLAQAQLFAYKAFDEPNKEKRITMAEQAIQIYERCADAYVILAENKAASADERLEYYLKGITAGKDELGAEAFANPKETLFWKKIHTRPFMRALEGVAKTYYEKGMDKNAFESWAYALALDPKDEQGVRYLFIPAAIAQEFFEEAEMVMVDFKQDLSAPMLYSKALLSFKKQGANVISEQALDNAVANNNLVLKYLLGVRSPSSKRLPRYFKKGSIEEADFYFNFAHEDWHATTGAVEWVVEYMRRRMQKVRLAETFPGL